MLLKSTVPPHAIMRGALVCLALSSSLPLVARRVTEGFWAGMLDGAQGAFLGAAIMLLAIFFRRKRTQAD